MGGWSGRRAARLARGFAGRRGRWCGRQEGPSLRIKEPGCRGRSGWSQAGVRFRELGFDPSPGPSWPLPPFHPVRSPPLASRPLGRVLPILGHRSVWAAPALPRR